MFDFTGEKKFKHAEDDFCYDIYSIASYVQDTFGGRRDVSLDEIWLLLDKHPVFPSDGYRTRIKDVLKKDFGAQISGQKILFQNRR